MTSLIALCSNLCFPETIVLHTSFKTNPLQLQLIEEKKEPLFRDLLCPLFKGRKLVTVQTAAEKLRYIARTIAGPGEKARVEALFTVGVPSVSIPKIEIIPDLHYQKIADNPETLDRIGEMNLGIFGTGLVGKYTVVTANKTVALHLSRHEGCSVFVHVPRAFVEQRPSREDIKNEGI